jgi:hypothetical protein
LLLEARRLFRLASSQVSIDKVLVIVVTRRRHDRDVPFAYGLARFCLFVPSSFPPSRPSFARKRGDEKK